MSKKVNEKGLASEKDAWPFCCHHKAANFRQGASPKR
jgi:hypothetical protein